MLLSIDGTIIFVFISFVVFIFLMHLICYKPIMSVIEEREKLLFKNKQTVDATNNKTQKVKEEIEEELSKTKFESSQMLKEAMETNKKETLSVLQTKKLEALKEIEDYENNLENDSNSVKNCLKSEVSNYVKSTVSKILKINPDDVNVDDSKLDEILK